MQIITLDDERFAELLIAWREGKCLGCFWHGEKKRTVCASRQFLLVASENGTSKFAMKPTRSLEESEALGLQLLRREEKRGHRIEMT